MATYYRWEVWDVITTTTATLIQSGATYQKTGSAPNGTYLGTQPAIIESGADNFVFDLSGATNPALPTSSSGLPSAWWASDGTTIITGSPITPYPSYVCMITNYSSSGWITVTRKWTFDVYGITVNRYQGSHLQYTVDDTNANAHPDNGYQNGYWYVKVPVANISFSTFRDSEWKASDVIWETRNAITTDIFPTVPSSLNLYSVNWYYDSGFTQLVQAGQTLSEQTYTFYGKCTGELNHITNPGGIPQRPSITSWTTQNTLPYKLGIIDTPLLTDLDNEYRFDKWKNAEGYDAPGYIVDDVLLTNLVPSPEYLSYSNATLDNGVITFAPGVTAMVQYDLPTPIPGHRYYGRVDQKVESNTSVGDGRFEYFFTDAAGTGLMTFASFMNTTKDGQWHTYSDILELNGLASDHGWKLRTFAVNSNKELQRRNHLIIDLTDAFGEDNEPTKEWCDDNIPFFVNTIVNSNSTISASWIKTWKLNYISSQGTPPSNTFKDDGYVLKASDLEIAPVAGYRFNGWYSGSSKIEPGYVIHSDLTITADWIKIWTISYSTEHATAPDPKVVDEHYIITSGDLPRLAEDWWIFNGWFIDGEPAEEYEVLSDVLVEADWEEAPTAIITYDSKWGTPPASKEVWVDYRLKASDVPVLSDIDKGTFKGWFYDAEYTLPVSVDDPIEGDTTLHAQWYTGYSLIIKKKNETLYISPHKVGAITFTNKGFTLDNGDPAWLYSGSEPVLGFSSDIEAIFPEYVTGETLILDDIPTNGNKTLGITLRYTYTISYSTAHDSVEPKTIYSDQAITDAYRPIVEEHGYYFRGWFYDTDYEEPIELGDYIPNDITLYAKWDDVPIYTITYSTRFGSVADKYIYETDPITSDYLPELAKKLYSFDGWFYEDTYETQVEVGDLIPANTVFYAKWTRLNAFLVRFDCRGRCFPPEDQVVNNGDLATRPEDPIANGYIFRGWYTSLEYNEEWDFDSFEITEDTIIYASWKKPLEYKDVDWTQPMKQTYEFYRVDSKTWQDAERVLDIDSCIITRDATVDTLGSGSFECINELEECYIRVYLIAEQNGRKHRICLGTLMVQTPEVSYDGKRTHLTMDGYTSLIELKNSMPPIGYAIREGHDLMNRAFRNTLDHCQAPVIEPGYSKTLYSHFLANPDDTWFTFIKDLLANGESHFTVDEYGVISFALDEEINSATPVWVYCDDDKSILFQDIKDQRDLYNIPNVVEVVYSNGTSTFTGIARNDDENSITSTISRGREVVFRETNPNIPGDMTGDNAQQYIDAYAEKLLSNKSQLEHTITYRHGFCPAVKVGDGVIINYRAAGLINIKAKVISQNISCKTGCEVEETAVYMTNTWR